MKKDVYYLQTLILSLVFFQFSVGRYLIAQNTLLKNQEGGIISFYSERDGNPEIYIMNSDGSAQTRLT